MKSPSFFVRARSVMAPYLRPLLEHVAPIRALGLWWLGRRQTSTFTQGGHTYEVDPRDFGVTFELESTGDYEKQTRALCLSHLQPGMTFVDVGAHVGLYSIPAAVAVGTTGRVFSFDPDPENSARLERNIRSSGLGNIILTRKAVSNVNGPMTLHRSPYNTGDHQLFYKGRGRKTVAIESVSLDAFFANDARSIDVVKFDIQGAEFAALQGMERMLERHRGIRLFMEFAPSMLRGAGADPQALLAWLEARGFTLSVIDDALGTVTASDGKAILHACPDQAYVNLMCHRP